MCVNTYKHIYTYTCKYICMYLMYIYMKFYTHMKIMLSCPIISKGSRYIKTEI